MCVGLSSHADTSNWVNPLLGTDHTPVVKSRIGLLIPSPKDSANQLERILMGWWLRERRGAGLRCLGLAMQEMHVTEYE